jgi:hypothetical protein
MYINKLADTGYSRHWSTQCLTLALLVAWIRTDNTYHTATFDDLAVPAHFLY